MALIAETLVDEWLNRQGFFTVRGLKHGVDEVDLLGVRPSDEKLDGWHVEVQASFRPIGYISPLTPDYAKDAQASRRSARKRDQNTMECCAAAWIEQKYRAEGKVKARESAWPGLDWTLVFVHAVVREPQELACIADAGVRVIPLHEILADLRHKNSSKARGGAGTDLAEIIEYYNDHVRRG